MSVPQELHGFILQDSQEYKDCGHTGYLYKNKKFGCPFLYIRTEDTNNFFIVFIRTPEEDNTGISHMLEHLSLRGSEKYPINRVFFELSKRSYSNFMNAFTASEYTSFPFASINQTDFLNNLDVYLDCVYHPKLSEVSFLSECHHLLFEDGDPSKPLVHGGVIYNEVAGKYSQKSTIFLQKLNENLYPDSPTRFDCGGTPSDIPKATFENVVNHHRRYYHPVNSFFYFYGNTSFPMEDVFSKVAEVIDQFDVIESPYHPELYQMKPWTEPRSVVIDAPADEKTPLDDQNQITISYVIDEKSTNDLSYNLGFLTSMLGETNNSPLYQSLVVPGHVKEATISLNDDTLYPSISISATGFLKEKSDEIEKIIFDVIRTFSEDTSEKANTELFERLDCYYHSIKLSNKKVPESLGLVLFYIFASFWIHGMNPLKSIDFDKNLESSYECCKKEGYLRSLAKRFLVDNKHCLISRLNPVQGFNERRIEEEKKRLEDYKKSLTESQVAEILDNMKRIEEEQSKPQPIHLLPQIRRIDISKKIDLKPPDFVHNDQIDVFINPTNGVVYAHIIVKMPRCDVPNLWMLSLVNTIINNIGAGKFDEFELTKYMQRWFITLITNGEIECSIEGKQNVKITVSAECLFEDIDKMKEMMVTVATDARWQERQKIEIVINKFKIIVGKAMDAINIIRAGSLLDEENAIFEAISGLIGLNKFLTFLNEKTVDEVAEACELLYNQILTNGKIRGYISCSEEMKETAVSAVSDVIHKIESLQKIEYTPYDYASEIFEKVKSKKTFIDLPVTTGAVCLKKLIVEKNEVKTSVCLTILAAIMTNEAVLDQVREKLGAYSGEAAFGPRSGVFCISTYRDSVPQKSYEAILDIIKNIDSYITDETVERAVVSLLSISDIPQLPQTKGLNYDMCEINVEQSQKRRDVFLSATADDVKEAAKLIKNGEFNVSIATSSNIVEPPEGFDVINV